VDGNPNMKRFDSAELFSGGSSTLDWLGAGNNGWTSGTNLHVFPNLRTLHITGPTSLEPGIFSGLPQLRDLDLRDNPDLTHLEPDVFAGKHAQQRGWGGTPKLTLGVSLFACRASQPSGPGFSFL
jgi:hypothetical protein